MKKGKESETGLSFQLWIYVGGCITNQDKEYTEGRGECRVDGAKKWARSEILPSVKAKLATQGSVDAGIIHKTPGLETMESPLLQ